MGAACGWCVGFGFRSLVVSSSVRDPRCWFLVCWCCFGCVGSACPACVALCCSALPCVRFVCSGRDELIVSIWISHFLPPTAWRDPSSTSSAGRERKATNRRATFPLNGYIGPRRPKVINRGHYCELLCSELQNSYNNASRSNATAPTSSAALPQRTARPPTTPSARMCMTVRSPSPSS